MKTSMFCLSLLLWGLHSTYRAIASVREGGREGGTEGRTERKGKERREGGKGRRTKNEIISKRYRLTKWTLWSSD